MIHFHYHRYDGHYDGVSLWTWDRDGRQNPVEQDLVPSSWDDYGPCFVVDPAKYGTTEYDKWIGFIVRRHHDWGQKDGEDRFWTPSMGNHMWLVGGDPEIHRYRPDTSPKVQAAYVDSDRGIILKLSHRIELGRLVPRIFQLRSAGGTICGVSSVKALDAHSGSASLLEVISEHAIDHRYQLFVLLDGYRPGTAVARNVLFDPERFFDGGEFGALYSREKTTFRLFAPTARQVAVALYAESRGSRGRQELNAQPVGRGVWEAIMPGDLAGTYYRWVVEGGEGLGRRELVDIHCRCTAGHDGHGLIVDLRATDPEGFRPIASPPVISRPTDAIIVEYSVRDFTRSASSGVPDSERGKYLGFARRGTRLPGSDVTTGIDHLVELGVTHVQLLPVQDFDNNEAHEEYNWGYMTSNFSSPDGWYASQIAGDSRVREFKALVNALHDANIRVVMDVVYNHTSPLAGFEDIAPRYYHRRTEDGRLWNGSGCGNEFKSEAPMARKFIVDSCRYWVQEFGVDGFRFDLMGLIDLGTMIAIRDELRALDPTLLLYGEPWAATGQDGTGVPRITYKDVIAGHGIGAFNDHFRNSLKGSPDGAGTGYVQDGSAREGVMKGILGSIHDWAREPSEAIQYATCHDNLCLYDKLEESAPWADELNRLKMQGLTNAILAISQGVMFLHGGEEFARTKLGHHNSYNLPDSVNAVDWYRKKSHPTLFEHTRGMIAVRKAHPIFRLPSRAEIEARVHFRDDLVGHPTAIAVHYDGKGLAGEAWSEALVFINPDEHDHDFRLPEGDWDVYVQGAEAGLKRLLRACEVLPVLGRSVAVVARS